MFTLKTIIAHIRRYATIFIMRMVVVKQTILWFIRFNDSFKPRHVEHVCQPKKIDIRFEILRQINIATNNLMCYKAQKKMLKFKTSDLVSQETKRTRWERHLENFGKKVIPKKNKHLTKTIVLYFSGFDFP